MDANAFKQIEVFRELYLGPVSDVDSLEYEYIKWKSIRAEIIRLHNSGEIQEGASRTKTTGIGGQQAEVVLRSLKNLSNFATGKGDELYANSRELNNALNKQLFILVVIIVSISLLISWFLLRAMRKPIAELIGATQRFRKGDLAARSSNTSNNEFGELSDSFNALADDIQANLSLSENIANISGIMLSEDDELTEQNTELELQKKQLSQASQMKTAFFSNMSHELRTPLNSVIALSGVLYKRLANKIPEDEYSYIEIIQRNGKILLNLINDVLDIARIEAGREDLEIIKFNSAGLIDELVNSLSLEVNQKKIKLIHKKTDPGISITSDEKKCRHILQNLIGNAVKFTEKGKVEVSAKQIDNNLMITVTDTGIGISEDQLANIFDAFIPKPIDEKEFFDTINTTLYGK